jgi:hypothetical protein
MQVMSHYNILQITEIEVTKNYYPSDDTGIAAEDRYQQNLHILLITMAVSGLKSAQKQRLHNAKKPPIINTNQELHKFEPDLTQLFQLPYNHYIYNFSFIFT